MPTNIREYRKGDTALLTYLHSADVSGLPPKTEFRIVGLDYLGCLKAQADRCRPTFYRFGSFLEDLSVQGEEKVLIVEEGPDFRMLEGIDAELQAANRELEAAFGMAGKGPWGIVLPFWNGTKSYREGEEAALTPLPVNGAVYALRDEKYTIGRIGSQDGKDGFWGSNGRGCQAFHGAGEFLEDVSIKNRESIRVRKGRRQKRVERALDRYLDKRGNWRTVYRGILESRNSM